MSLLRKAKNKTVLCTHCGKPNEVGGKAMSVFCNHCRKRLILENVTIKSYQGVKGYATCGDVVVEKSGRVNAGIQAGNLTIKGHVNGQVLARGTVHVAKTGVLIGSVEAHALDILPGAAINAVCRIGPPAHPIDEPAPPAATAPLSPPEPSTTPKPRRERIPDEPVIEGAVFAPSVIRPREVAARQRAASEAAAVARANAPKTPPAQSTEQPSPEKKATKSKSVSTKTAAKKATVKKTKKTATKKKTVSDSSTKSATSDAAKKSAAKKPTDKKSDDKKPPTNRKIKKITTRRTRNSE